MFLAMDCGQPDWRWNPIRIFNVNQWFSGNPAMRMVHASSHVTDGAAGFYGQSTPRPLGFYIQL
jgi:hypothetical protein